MKNVKKTIALYPFNEKRHSVFNPLISVLKENYNLVYNPKKSKKIKIIA